MLAHATIEVRVERPASAHAARRFTLGVSARGDLIVADRSRIRVIAPTGMLLRSYGIRARNGYAFDAGADTLLFVTPNGRLAAGTPRNVRPQAHLWHVDGTLSLTPGRLVVFSGAYDLEVVRRDGIIVARARWSAAAGSSDSGSELAPDGHALAFRLSTARPGDRSGTAAVYVLRPGDSAARVVYRDRFGPVGCGAGAVMRWRGDDLLYRRSGAALRVIYTHRAS